MTLLYRNELQQYAEAPYRVCDYIRQLNTWVLESDWQLDPRRSQWVPRGLRAQT